MWVILKKNNKPFTLPFLLSEDEIGNLDRHDDVYVVQNPITMRKKTVGGKKKTRKPPR
jgi:hypothetical protein